MVTASGDVPTEHPALQSGALVATTADGARRLEGHLPPTCATLTADEGLALHMADVLAALHAQGHTAVLTEGGPQLMGHLLGEGLLDELFLTTSPVLAGRDGTSRPGVVAGLELLPNQSAWTDLISVRRRDSYLFLRYRLRPRAAEARAPTPDHRRTMRNLPFVQPPDLAGAREPRSQGYP